MVDITGDGVNDLDITAAGSFTTIGGVIFTDAVKVGSGTGNYNTFLAISNNSGVESGFNSDDTPPIDATNADIDHAKTHTVLLSDLVIVTVDGQQYYQFRIDLNEANSDPNAQISLDQFKLYSSSNGGINSTTALFNPANAQLEYDMDAGGNVSVLLSDAESSGSGTDDYAILVPVSQFAGLDPTTTYIYLYAQMGAAGTDWSATATFEEWNLENGVALTGVKFDDANNNGIRDAGEAGVAGVTIFIDADKDGVFDADERSTVTDSNGNYTFYGVALNQTVWIDEVVPAGATQTTGAHEVVVIGDKASGTITVDPIGNFIPRPEMNVSKAVTSITGGQGLNGLTGADSDGDVINYAISIANTGNVVLTGITLSDPNADPGSIQAVMSGGFNTGDTNMNGAFDAGETWNYTATHTVTQAELDGQGIDDTGAIDGDGDDDNTVTADTNETGPDTASAAAPLIYNPALNVSKSVTSITGGQGLNGLTGADSDGDVINYAISVANTGNITLTGLSVTDPNADPGSILEVQVGGFNTGDTDTDGVFDVGETWNFTATHTVTQAELNGQGIDDTGAIDGDGDDDNTVTADTNETGPDTASAAAPLIYNPALNVSKSVTSITGGQGLNGLTGADSDGDVINYAISVANTGNITLTGLIVTDPNADPGSILEVQVGGFNTGDTDTDGVFDVGETWNFTATHTVTQAELDGQGIDDTGAIDGDGDDDNTVTADTNETGPDTASAAAPLIYNPLVDLEKLVSVNSTDGTDGTFVDADTADLGPENVNIGSDVWFKVTLENTGNVTLTDVDVVDNNTSAGLPGTFFDLVIDGQLTADAINNHGATLVGDTDGDHNLDVDETWTITYSQAFDAGDHVNTATVTTDENATDNDAAHYFSLVNEGPGVRTPGFWQNMNNGGQFWDGIVGNEKNAGQDCFADGELLYAVDSNNDEVINGSDQAGLLIGDYDKDGLTGGDEDTLFVSYADARSLINASNKQLNGLSGDGKFMLGRDMIATWLNFLAGNNIGDAADTDSPHHYLDDSIDWMQIFSGNTNGGTAESFDSFKLGGPAIKTSSATWNSPQSGIDHSASQMHGALDHYNNTGQTEDGGTFYAHDCDDANFVLALHAISLV